MAESKRTGLKGTMNKDVDDRLIPEGQYRDALNISVGHSEGSDVGAIENIRGNALVAGTAQAAITGTVIGTTVDSETGYIYYFVSETDKDIIYEYNTDTDAISIVLIDSRAAGSQPDESDETDPGGGGGGSTETFTVSVTSFTGSVVDVSTTAGSSTYKISLSASATSTGSEGTTRNISTFNFKEYTDGTYATLVTTQPGTDFNTNVAAANGSKTVETTTITKAATTRYFKVTTTDQNGDEATDTVSVAVTAGVASLNASASVPSSVTQGATLSISVSLPTGGISPYSYSWTGPNGFTSSSRTPTVTSSASSAHAGQYNVVVTDSSSPANTITRGGSVAVTTFGTPSVNTLAASGINVTEIQFNGEVVNGGNPGVVSSRGFYYYKNTDTTSAPLSTVVGQGTRVTEGSSGNGTFSKIVSGLDGSSHYDYVAWASNGSNEGKGAVMRATTLASGTQSITFSPTSLTNKPHQSATYTVDLTLNNLPDSNLTTSITYATGGSGWISSVTRNSGTNTYQITFGAMTVQSATSPSNRVASITFTNPSSGVSAQLSCHQTTNASIALSANSQTPVTSMNKLGGSFGLDTTVSFDPAGTQAGQWSFYDTLPSWITPTPNTSYLGSTTVTFTVANNNSGADRNHTFDARINDGNQNDATYQIKDTLSISQNQSVNFRCYEFNGLQEKTGLIFYTQSGAFQQAQFSPTQGSNTSDNSLRLTASPTGTNSSEVTSIQWKMDYVFGGNYSDTHFSVNNRTVPSTYTDIDPQFLPGGSAQGGQFNLTVTAPAGAPSQPSLSRRLNIRVGNGTSYDVHTVSLNRSAT